MIELYINGSSGRMGTTINDLVNANDEFNVTDNLTSADVVIDFSHPSSTKKIINSCLKHNIPMVIGTTGLNKDVLENIDIASKTLPIVLAANMSVGVHQLKDSLKSFIKKESIYGPDNYKPLPVVLSKAKGVWVWDVSEKKYLDMMSGYSAVSHGHAHPVLLKTFHDQSSRLSLTSRAFYTDTLGPYLETITQLVTISTILKEMVIIYQLYAK